MSTTSAHFRPLLLAKLQYFFLFGALAAFIPYISLFYISRSLSPSQAGILLALPAVLTTIFTPLWSALADTTQTHKILILFLTFFSLLIVLLLLIQSFTFMILFVIIFFYSLLHAPLTTLIDVSIISMLSSLSLPKTLYGRLRLWGAISWGIVAVVVGFLLDYTQDMNSIIYCYAFGKILFIVTMLFIPTSPAVPSNTTTSTSTKTTTSASTNTTFVSDLQKLLKYKTFSFFLGTSFVMGATMSIITNYLFVYLKTEYDASKTLLGISLVFTVLIEIPFFHYADKILQRFTPFHLIIASHIGSIIRMVGYPLLPSPVWVLPLELFHGLTFAAMWVAAIEYISDVAKPRLRTTAQGLFTAMFEGVGSGFGAIVGGIVYDVFGPHKLFYGMGVVLTCNLLLFILTQWNGMRNLKSTKHDDLEDGVEMVEEIVEDPELDTDQSPNLNEPHSQPDMESFSQESDDSILDEP